MKLISNIRRAFKYLYLSFKLNKAVRIADKRQEETGITQYVVKGRGDTLLVLTRKQYRTLVNKRKARKVTAEQMYQGCFYCTRWFDKNTPTPKEIIEKKRRIYFAAFLN